MLNRRVVAVALGVGILFTTTISRGQALADRVPSDAIAYAGWAGSDALGPAYDASHLKAFLESLKVPQIVADRMKADAEKAGNPTGAKLGQELLAITATSPSAVFMGPLDTAGDQPQPRVAFFSRVGKERAADLAARLAEAMKRDRTYDKTEAVAAGDFLLVESKNIDLRERLAGAAPADNLAGQESFKKALARLGPDAAKSAVVGYADGQALLDTINQAAPKIADPEHMLPAFLSGSGLTSLRQVVWAGNFDGADWQSSGFVGMRERRNGFLAFMDNPPLTDASLKMIPKNATEAGVFRFDGARLMQDISDAAAKVNDNAPKQIEQVVTEIYKFTGIDMKRDLFPALGDEFVYYTSNQAAPNSIRGITIVNRLRDPVKGQTVADNVENFINLLILQRDPDSKTQFKARPLPAPLDKIEAHEMTVDRIMPSWAIVDGVLYMTLSEEALVAAIQQAQAKDCITDNPTFAAMRKKLGQEKFASFDFVDLPKASRELYAIAQREMQLQNPAPTFTLPPLNTITPSLSPVLSISWTDADGFHAKSSSPFPFADYVRPSEYLIIASARQIEAQRRAAAAAATAPAASMP